MEIESETISSLIRAGFDLLQPLFKPRTPPRLFPLETLTITPPGRRTGSPEYTQAAAVFHGFRDEVSTSPPETALLVSLVLLRTPSCLRAKFCAAERLIRAQPEHRRNFTAPPAPPRRCTAAEPTPPPPSPSPRRAALGAVLRSSGEVRKRPERRRPRQRHRPLHRRPPERRHGKVFAP